MKWTILTSMMVSVLIMAVGANNITGNWFECPVTIVTYPGCNVSVHAYFEAFLVPPHESVDCSQNFKFLLFLNGVPNQPDPIVTVTNNTEDGGNICRVVGHIAAVPVGNNDVEFRAQYIGTEYEAVTLKCDDHLLAEVPHPTINEPIITCDGVLVKWAEHPSVNDSNHGDILYSLVVMETSLSYSTSNTSVLIPCSDGLEYDTLYTVQLSSVYCGNQGNVTNTTLYTAMAPNVTIDKDGSMTIHRTNSTHGSITSTIKMDRDDCIVSHPKTVTTNMSCTSSLVHEGESRDRITDKPVTVRHDGSIKVDTTVPVDHRCTVGLTFNNGELSTPTDPFDINTNQVRNCTFIANTHGIVSTCNYLYPSTDLWGCRVELMMSDLTILDTIDVSMTQEHGFFNHLCNDVYILKCYGLLYNPNNNNNGSTQPLVVSYDNSPDHTRTVTVTAGDTSCTSSGVTVSTGTRLTSTSTPMVSPSMDPSATNSISMVMIIVIVVVILLIVLLIIAVIVISVVIRQRKKQKVSISSPTNNLPMTKPEQGKLENNSTANPAYHEGGEPVILGDSVVGLSSVSTTNNGTTTSETENGQLTATNPSINSERGSIETVSVQEGGCGSIGTVSVEEKENEEEGVGDEAHKMSKIKDKRDALIRMLTDLGNTRRESGPSPQIAIATVVVDNTEKRILIERINAYKHRSTGYRRSVHDDKSNVPLLEELSGSAPPSDEMIGDTSFTPPSANTSTGTNTFVIPEMIRSNNVTLPRSPKKIEPRSDEQGLLSEDVDNHEEVTVSINDLHSPTPPPLSSHESKHASKIESISSSSKDTTAEQSSSTVNDTQSDSHGASSKDGASTTNEKDSCSTDEIPYTPSSNEKLDTNTFNKTDVLPASIKDLSNNNTNPSSSTNAADSTNTTNPSSSTNSDESPRDKEPAAESSHNDTTQVSNTNDNDKPLPSTPIPIPESQLLAHAPMEESRTGKEMETTKTSGDVGMRNRTLFVPSTGTPREVNSESSKSTQQSTAITHTDILQKINDDSHDDYFTNEGRQPVSKDIGDYVPNKEADVSFPSTNNSESLLLQRD